MGVVANVAVNIDARDGRRQLNDLANTSKRTEAAIGGITRAVGKLALAYGTLRTAQAALQAGISRIESERRIQFLAKGYGEAAQLATAASRAAEKFGVSQTEANQALANTYARLRPVGVELQTIESIYAGFNTAARISGASAVEAGNAFTQLAQALGSGALRGDEFNSIAEQVPGILTAISKETGVAQGALRKYAAEGKITADVVISALQRIEREGADQLADALEGPQQKIKDFQKAAEDMQVALTRNVIPELTSSLKELSALILNLEGVITFIGDVAAGTIGTINDLINLATKPGQVAARKSIEGGRLPAFPLKGATEELFANVITPFGEGLSGVEAEARARGAVTGEIYAKSFAATMQKYLAVSDAAKKLDEAFKKGEGGRRTSTTRVTAPSKSDSKAAKKLADELARSLKAGRDLSTQFSRQVQQLNAATSAEKIRQQIQFDFLDRAQAISELKDAEQRASLSLLNDEIKRLELIKAENDELFKRAGFTPPELNFARAGADVGLAFGMGSLVNGGENTELDKARKSLEELIKPINQVKEVASGIGGAFTDSFRNVITGSMSAQEALASFFSRVADTFLDMAAQIITQLLVIKALEAATNIFGGGGGGLFKGAGPVAFPSGLNIGVAGFKANGGPVKGGSPYMVGERGPELFVPGRSGTIVPNNQLGGGAANVVVNVDASGSNVEGDDQGANQLGKVIGLAVQQELIKQRRPGGLLAGV